MYTIKQYNNDIISLARSLVIKFSDVANKVNTGVYLLTGETPPEDKTAWKYYLNLAGEKHVTNNDVTVYLKESNSRELLTKTLLETNQITRSALALYGDEYRALIDEYPDDVMYINGCISPVDINAAIEATDGAILSYSKEYVYDNELSIIRYLEVEIKGFIDRWYVKNYNITDELYLSSFIGVLLTMVPATIKELRLKRVYTHEAHPFHIEHFFRSKLDIWDDVKYLNKKSMMWLYANLNYLMKNPGTNKTLEIIADKIFDSNGVGLGYYTLGITDPTLNPTQTINEASFSRGDLTFRPNKLNDNFNIDTITTKSLEEIVSVGLFNTTDIDVLAPDFIKETIVANIEHVVNSGVVNTQQTKILELGVNEVFRLYGNDDIAAALDNWLYHSAVIESYTARTAFTDPNTKIEYFMTPYDGLLLFYYLVGEVVGGGVSVVDSIKYSMVVDSNVTKETLGGNLYSDTGTSKLIDVIHDLIPNNISFIRDNTVFKERMESLIKLYNTVWVLDSCVNNTAVSCNIKHIVSRLYTTGSYITGGVNLIDFLSNKNILPTINTSYDVNLTITALFTTFTGLDMSKYSKVSDSMGAYSNLLNKLTSYTTQIIKPDSITDTLYAPFSTIEVNNPDLGIINILGGQIDSPYATEEVSVISESNDLATSVTGVVLASMPYVGYSRGVTGINTFTSSLEGELTGSVDDVVLYSEILTDIYDPYAPLLLSSGSTIDPQLRGAEYFDHNVINLVRDINTTVIPYSLSPVENELVGVISEPNTIVDIDENTYGTPTITIT